MTRKVDNLLLLGVGVIGLLMVIGSHGAITEEITPVPPYTPPKLPIQKQSQTNRKPDPIYFGVINYQVDGNGVIYTKSPKDSLWSIPKLDDKQTAGFRSMIKNYKELVEEITLDYRMPESWIWAIMWAESRGYAGARSPKNAMGLMQILQCHFKQGESPYDPRTNIQTGVRLMQSIYGQVKGVIGLIGIASAYNVGSVWTNESWLVARRNAIYLTPWGVPAEPGYIDKVVEANNTFLTMGNPPS